IDLTIEEGSFVVLLGPSGGGKTTLLNILGGFLEPTAGQVLIKGADVTHVPPARRPTTTVFQDYALFPHMTIAGNVGFGLAMRGVAKTERRRRVEAALEMVGLAHTRARKVHQLSGGQKQRIALARALVVEPAVLLLDEPLGALDLKLRRQMQEELKAIQKRVGTTFVHVTHDQDEAMAIADTIVVMNEGRIEDQGAPERIYLRPKTRFAADFMGDSNFIDGRVIEAAGDRVTVDTALGRFSLDGAAAVGQAVTLSVRPEHVQAVAPAAAAQPLGTARVLEAGFFGTHHQCTAVLEAAERPFKVRLPQKDAIAPGAELALFADPADMVLLTR
ncbi:MAG: ABC transporter ATP-binding protein, partial [Kiloniellales bacterium]|nr:ABC transporter ATP-binding protein [Kiloniellales bacterium]